MWYPVCICVVFLRGLERAASHRVFCCPLVKNGAKNGEKGIAVLPGICYSSR